MTALTPTLPQEPSDKEMVEAVARELSGLLENKAPFLNVLGTMLPNHEVRVLNRAIALIRRSPADDTPKGWRLVKIADLATILALLPPKPLVKNGLMYMCADAEPGDRLHQIRDAFDTMLSNAPPAPGSNG